MKKLKDTLIISKNSLDLCRNNFWYIMDKVWDEGGNKFYISCVEKFEWLAERLLKDYRMVIGEFLKEDKIIEIKGEKIQVKYYTVKIKPGLQK